MSSSPTLPPSSPTLPPSSPTLPPSSPTLPPSSPTLPPSSPTLPPSSPTLPPSSPTLPPSSPTLPPSSPTLPPSSPTLPLPLHPISYHTSLHPPQPYYQDAVAAFVVFDVTDKKSFEDSEQWKADIDQKASLPGGRPIPVVLLANKVGERSLRTFYPSIPPLVPPFSSSIISYTILILTFLQWDMISSSFFTDATRQLDEHCKDKGYVGWFKTSAKENMGIDGAAKSLVLKVCSGPMDVNWYDNKMYL